LQVYEGTCFGHVMSKTCQYVTNDDKVSMGLTLVNVKKIQAIRKKNLNEQNNQEKEATVGKNLQIEIRKHH
jgi:hypothetical protein